VLGDERRLRQILLNLLGNAVKFTEDGEVTLQVSSYPHSSPLPKGEGMKPSSPGGGKLLFPLPLREGQGEGMKPSSPGGGKLLFPLPLGEGQGEGFQRLMRFAVRDTGVGISSEDVAVIFEPYRQVGDVTKQAKGTGLGLAITRNLVTLMGGELRVESQVGRGSTFYFELTLPEVISTTELPAPPQTTIVGIAAPSLPPTILVVDDNWENRAVLVGLLTPLGFKVREATSGLEGLAQAVAEKPSIIITDLIMPDLDGFELIRQIRQNPQLGDIVIFAASASVYEADHQRSLEIGADAFLPKPIDMGQLLALLEVYLGLTWRYEMQDVAMDKPVLPMIAPSSEIINQLLELTKMGDVMALEEEARLLSTQNPAWQPFATELLRLAATFQTQAIRSWLESLRG